MTSSIISTPAIDLTDRQQQDDRSAQCQLQWRQHQLWVKRSQDVKQLYLPPLDNEQWLVKCLQHSPIRLVKIDPILGEAVLKRWANVCDRANKPVFLSGTVAQKLRSRQNRWSWRVIRLIDAIAALVLLMFLSPVMLATAVLIYIDSPGAIFSHSWQVGARGKLFKALKFRTTQLKKAEEGRQKALMFCTLREANATEGDSNPSLPCPPNNVQWGQVPLLHKSRGQRTKPFLLPPAFYPLPFSVMDNSCPTQLGDWLCSYRLDELPQLFNVLRGEMSLMKPQSLTLSDAVQLSLVVCQP
jgi:lipopolysaccharide/colanic/teichoic acid biosynthesis glycosyltransferase